MAHLGIDIGGTKTAVGLFDENYSCLAQKTIPTQANRGCVDLANRIAQIYRELLEQTGLPASAIESGGVASPGPLNPVTGRIVYIPTMGFRDEPLIELLTQALSHAVDAPVPQLKLENDTNLAALCESVFGAGQDVPVVAYVTVSTGIGCGIVSDRHILSGGGFAAGELGHFKTQRNGRPCNCGGCGCLEQYASGTAIAQIASERFGREMDAKEVFALARMQNETALAVVQEAAEELGYAIAALYQVLDPDILVLGGSVMRDYDVFGPLLKDSVDRYVQHVPGRTVHMTVSSFDGDQVLLGAAYYGAQK